MRFCHRYRSTAGGSIVVTDAVGACHFSVISRVLQTLSIACAIRVARL